MKAVDPQKGIIRLFIKKNIFKRIQDYFNDFKLSKKLRIMYVYCIVIPLIITDSVIMMAIVKANKANTKYESQNIGNMAKYNLSSTVKEVETVSNYIYTNININDFLNKEYSSVLDYYIAYTKLKDSTWMLGVNTSKGISVTLYADNDTILNGGGFLRLDDKVKVSAWYQELSQSNENRLLYITYDNSSTRNVNPYRRISLIRKQKYFQYRSREQIMRIDLDYNYLLNEIVEMKYDAPVYLCLDGKILFSNEGHSNVGKDFDYFNEWSRVRYQDTFNVYGKDIDIYVLHKNKDMLFYIFDSMPLIILLICFNIILPWGFMYLINQSFTQRIQKLSSVFENTENEKMLPVEEIQGKDEIGLLMQNYNRMVTRIDDLIQTVYRDKLKEQESNIARKNAELLALHSQINPHFLFNALESIRMHSIIKKEIETAHMVERLAVMERRYVDWANDNVTIEEEVEGVEAYLEIQKYRFGDRISYRLEIEEECKKYRIPQLTMITFVENACIHGIESKSVQGWIFVRVYKKGNNLLLEIEDTGYGIEEPALSELKNQMENAEIDLLKKKKQVGIINACTRLRMMTEDKVTFELESEKGAGTIITVNIPLEAVTEHYQPNL